MKLIIQIPAFNEEKVIARTIRDLPRRIEGITSIETLLIDDGSTDRTVAEARAAGVNHVVQLLSHRGLATAFKVGIDAALELGADIIANTDADNQYRGADLARLVEPIVSGAAEVVIGDRDTRTSRHMSGMKKLLQRLGSWTVGLASGLSVPDVTSGFRAFSREAAFQINVFNPFTYTLETIIQAGNRNLQVQSVRIETNAPTRESRLYTGIGSYVRKSIATIFRIYTLYKPLKTFFTLGAIVFLAGVVLGGRFLYYYYFTESPGGHVQSVILAAALLVIGFQTALIGLVADLISVNRRLSEEILIRLKKQGVSPGTGMGLQQNTRPGRAAISPPPSRRPDRSRPKEIAAREPVEPLPAKPPETQWVWLGDEKKLDGSRNAESRSDNGLESESSTTAPSPGGAKRKRRRRKRSGGDEIRHPERNHHRPADHSGTGAPQHGSSEDLE